MCYSSVCDWLEHPLKSATWTPPSHSSPTSNPSLNLHSKTSPDSGHHSHSVAQTFIHAFIPSSLDDCNGVLSRVPSKALDRFQHVQNWAARVPTRTKPWKYIIPILIHLYWLPVKSRISQLLQNRNCFSRPEKAFQLVQPQGRKQQSSTGVFIVFKRLSIMPCFAIDETKRHEHSHSHANGHLKTARHAPWEVERYCLHIPWGHQSQGQIQAVCWFHRKRRKHCKYPSSATFKRWEGK